MARIQHIAIAANDPASSAEFYKRVFDMKEVRRSPADSGAEGVWLTDGYILLALRTPHSERGLLRTQDGTGLHHLGFAVEDVEETGKKLMAEEHDRSTAPKYVGPDGVFMETRGLDGYEREVKLADDQA